MPAYTYAFRFEAQHEDVFICFPQFPEIITSLDKKNFESATSEFIQDFATDAAITALQARIMARLDIPEGVDQNIDKADGFITLSVQQAMKLELFKLYKANTASITDFSRQIGKPDTSARRLLNLRHPSWTSEIEAAIATFGKRLVHNWDTAVVVLPARGAKALSLPSHTPTLA